MPTSAFSSPNPEPFALAELVVPKESTGAGGDLNVRYRGRLLYPERGPALFPERVALAVETGTARLHLVASPLLWYGADSLRARLGPGSALLFIEADPVLAALARERLPPWLGTDGKSAFVASADPERLLAAARELGSFRLCVATGLSGAASLNARAYREAALRIQSEFSAAWRNRAALMAMGRLWARNIFRNLAALPEIAPRPLPRFRKPTIVLGAGPSLEEALPFILRNRGRLALIACDTALATLASLGIVPDLAVCLEGQAHNLPDFTPLGGRELPLLADISSNSATFRALRGPRHLSIVAISPGRFCVRLGGRLYALGLPVLAVPPLGSVGVHALHVARRISAGPLLASGLDFAFEPGKTHARGSPALLAEEWSMTRFSRWPRQAAAAWRKGVRTADGTPRPAASADRRRLLTDPILESYAALFAEEASGTGPPVLDLRGRGLPLGLRQVSVPDAEAFLDALPDFITPGESPGAAGESLDAGTLGAGTFGAGAIGAAALAFLTEERGRVERLRDALRGRNPLERTEFLSLVEESDYLTWPLPDAERLGEMPQDLLNRLLVETEYWVWRIGESRDRLADVMGLS